MSKSYKFTQQQIARRESPAFIGYVTEDYSKPEEDVNYRLGKKE